MRTYFESEHYENMAVPGTFARLMVIGDDDGPHFMFRDGDEIILDLPIPACDALAIRYALGRSAGYAIRAAEHLTEGFTEAGLARTAEPPPQLEPGMTPYGPREVRAEPEPVSLPRAQDTRELPVSTYSWMRQAALPEPQSA